MQVLVCCVGLNATGRMPLANRLDKLLMMKALSFLTVTTETFVQVPAGPPTRMRAVCLLR
jgi:hypothetical protein